MLLGTAEAHRGIYTCSYKYLNNLFWVSYEPVRWLRISHRGFFTRGTECLRALTCTEAACSENFPLSVWNQTCNPLIGLEFFGSLRNESNADVIEFPVFYFRGPKCRYIEKTSITVNIYLIPTFYLLNPWTSTKSHSQTSIILFTQ